ncbi:hypothetical protein [Mucilaginibacter ginsenosidivorax]|uniref:Uncharacterized protein n=1 Tax=Mucilaginibacter ginsenosidivorax TaxID=862126 RepID=A0A5B8W2C3_9SPHI|nr:hypothetical protein [Mucilaginibacter ginsenosidivorax]QEC77092.1 hypothetical protein FSB76_14480 [Mucilaginibacter ginsenosidivorax]
MVNPTDKLETKWQPIVMFYGVALLLIIIGASISPTNLAGAGIDLIFVLIAVIGNIVLLSRSVFKLIKHGKAFRVAVAIHAGVFMLWFGTLMFTVIYAAITSSK